MSTISIWDEINLGKMTLATIKERYGPESKFRVSLYHYEASARFSGGMQSALCHVLRGPCRYVFADKVFDLSEGDVGSLPSGRYLFEAVGPGPVDIVLVWELPPQT